MNEIKIYLKTSGSTAELYKDFNLYQGSYRNVEITLYVPTVLLYKNADNTFLNAVQTGAILTAANGAKVPTKSFNAEFVKTVNVGGIEYAEFTQIMPKEYVLYEGTQIIVCNIVNIDNTDETSPKIISVTTSQRVPLVVQESAYLSADESFDPTEAEVIEGLINDLQERLNNDSFAARAIYPYNSSYSYGAGELVFYPYKGEYGTFIKSLVADNKEEPYGTDGVLNSEYWEEITDFNILNDLYRLKSDVEQAAQEAAANAATAGQYASAAATSSQNAERSAQNAESAAQRVEAAVEYLEDVQNGTVAVPKAVADEKGNNIANQFGVVSSDIQGLRKDINNEAHFRGMFNSIEALKEKYPTATPNDYAYIVGGNVWIYEADGGWTDSDEQSPNTSVPASDAVPLMDGVGAAGTSSQYARGDHRHPSDTTKADTNGNYADMAVGSLTTSRTIDGVSFDGTSDIDHYAICQTAYNLVNKVVSKENFVLEVGSRITVKFTAANTVNSPTLNVNSTGAYPIIAGIDATYAKWIAGSVMEFVFSGSAWQCISGYALSGMRVGMHHIQYEGESTPASLYGGTWEIDTDYTGRVLVGSGTGYTIGATGGESTHKLTVAELPTGIKFDVRETNESAGGSKNTTFATSWNTFNTTNTDSIGLSGANGQSFNIMQPYKVVAIWKRTA